MTNRRQLIVFDLDGTLVDSRADLVAGVNAMRRHYDLEELSFKTVVSYIGDGVRKLIDRSLEGTTINREEAMAVNLDYYLSNMTVHTKPYAGVVEGIKRLSDAGYMLAVLTNKPGKASRDILSHVGLDRYLISIIGGGDGVALKPDPAGLLQLVKRAKVYKNDVWMIGDHRTDLSAAKNAAVKSAFVTYGFGVEGSTKPNTYFASFSQLVEYFV